MIQLKKIDQTNYKNCVQLETTEEQNDYISPNWYSLLEANYEERKIPLAIYEKNEMVGFVMFGYYEADEMYPIPSWWLRIMIDYRFQQQGLGGEAMFESINWFEKNISADELRLSVAKTNDVALKLYNKFGFIRSNENIDKETVLVKSWRKSTFSKME